MLGKNRYFFTLGCPLFRGDAIEIGKKEGEGEVKEGEVKEGKVKEGGKISECRKMSIRDNVAKGRDIL